LVGPSSGLVKKIGIDAVPFRGTDYSVRNIPILV
jgi:hypothetical protein